VDNSLERGAKIIFLNGTSNESGGHFGQLYLEEENSFTFRRSLANSIQLVKEDDSFIPLIYCATGFRQKYYISTLPFKNPATVIDGQKRVNRTKEIKILN
jgi:hypothetical protein